MAKILIADDSALILTMLESSLTPLGHQVIKVSDGYSVIPEVNKHKPDLIVLDYQMPAASGVEVYGRLRSLATSETIPVIFLSATSPYELQYVIPEGPLVRFFQKPVNLPDFQAAVAEILAPKTATPPAAPPSSAPPPSF